MVIEEYPPYDGAYEITGYLHSSEGWTEIEFCKPLRGRPRSSNR